MKKENVDVLVIGAGPSGSVSGAYLNKHGIQVKVVEKSKFPRFQVGESLIPRCMDNFKEVGLLDCLMRQEFLTLVKNMEMAGIGLGRYPEIILIKR